MAEKLIVQGAKEHNLKNISVELPRDRLIVFTGLSGSGKSSLAFDTIFAEGQRRYVESLSSYARQFLGLMEKPDVDFIEGLSPAISIDQKSASKNPRSTVGTVTEVYDYLRLLYARIGVPHCPQCNCEVSKQSAEEIVDRLMLLDEGTRFLLLAPVVRGRKGEYQGLLDDLARKGFARARVDGEIIELSDRSKLSLARYENHSVDVVVDRLVIKDGIQRRLTDSVEAALELSSGLLEAQVVDKAGSYLDLLVFSEALACPNCGVSIGEVAPRSFSFNSPYGACQRCDGLGTRYEADVELVIPDERLSILQGAVAPWASVRSEYFQSVLESVARENDIPLNKPWSTLAEDQKKVVLYGTGEAVIVSHQNKWGKTRKFSLNYEGIIPWLERKLTEAESDSYRTMWEGYMRVASCPACSGARLKPESLSVTVDGLDIYSLCSLSISRCAQRISGMKLSSRDTKIAKQVIKEVIARLNFLLDVGLDYLTLARASASLSGGEAQRIRLASQIGSGLAGVLYVLDEPSIGLHQRDNHRLITTLTKLRDLGNTVIVVEHDEDTIKSADYIVDIGPGAGEHGGEVISAGSYADLCSSEASITGAYLSRRRTIALPDYRREGNGAYVTVEGARENNLKDITVEFPLGKLTAITGVSGSGKSTLVNEILLKGLRQKVYHAKVVPGRHTKISGVESIDKVVDIDQSPIGRTPRSNPATYTGVFDGIRKLFAETQESRARGYMPGRFSFNVRGGRCENCSGDGTIRIEMNFLPDVYVPCELCKGARYNRDTLEVTWKGKSIADVLDMSVSEANLFFSAQPKIARHLKTLDEVGLGYVKLGQSATTLSGGEAQRVKLATELSKRATGHTFYILDEPTTGLHFEDIRKLLSILSALVDNGNTVVVIEHNLDVIKTVDWIIDLGPEGGDNGGYVLAEGTPEEVAEIGASYTGQFLKPLIRR